jgi:hypothetical protein
MPQCPKFLGTDGQGRPPFPDVSLLSHHDLPDVIRYFAPRFATVVRITLGNALTYGNCAQSFCESSGVHPKTWSNRCQTTYKIAPQGSSDSVFDLAWNEILLLVIITTYYAPKA